MDGLAGSLAVIAAAFFACDAWLQHEPRLVLVISVALGAGVLGFLPFNLRPGKQALAWMGDSGSQLIGFTLASLGLASSYTVATSTVATLVLPVLILAVPILDTTLVTIVRLLEGRPVSQGGRDHSSHRLVSLGVSETGAVVLLALISAGLGATSLAYEAFGNGRIAAVGVLVTFALLIQFGTFLADVDRARAARSQAALRLHAPARRGRRRRRADRGVVPRRLPPSLQRHRDAEPAPLLPADAAGPAPLPLRRAAALRDVRGCLAVRELARRAARRRCRRRLGDRRGRHRRAHAGAARRLLAQRLRDRRADLRGGDHSGAVRRAGDRPFRRPRTQPLRPPRPDRRRRTDRDAACCASCARRRASASSASSTTRPRSAGAG